MPRFNTEISLGSVIQILVILAGIATGYGALTMTIKATEARLAEQNTVLIRHESELKALDKQAQVFATRVEGKLELIADKLNAKP